MTKFLAVTAILLTTASVGFAQSGGTSCGDVVNDPSASCPSVLAPEAGGSVNSGSGGSVGTATPNGSSRSAVDGNTTNSLPAVGQPRQNGAGALDVPINDLGNTQNGGAGNTTSGGNAVGGGNAISEGTATRNNNSSAPYSNQGVMPGGSAGSSGASGSSGSISSPSIN